MLSNPVQFLLIVDYTFSTTARKGTIAMGKLVRGKLKGVDQKVNIYHPSIGLIEDEITGYEVRTLKPKGESWSNAPTNGIGLVLKFAKKGDIPKGSIIFPIEG